MHFTIFQPDDMVILCLNCNESQSLYAYKTYAYIKRVYISCVLTVGGQHEFPN